MMGDDDANNDDKDYDFDRWNTSLENDGQQLGRVRIRHGIFQGDSLSLLVLIMAIIRLTYVLRQVKPACTTQKDSINYLLHMDDLNKLYGKSQNDITTLINTVRIYSKDIGMA